MHLIHKDTVVLLRKSETIIVEFFYRTDRSTDPHHISKLLLL